MAFSTLQKLAAICAFSATVPAASALVAAVDAAHVFGLIGRDTCTSNGLATCGSSLPSGWCCPSSTNCLMLNNTGTASALCCPAGNDCSVIEPISCNITLQDAAIFPSAAVHTQNLSISLPTCGDNCCPLGYVCNAGNCQMLNSTKQAQTASASASGSVASATATTSNTPTETAAPAKTTITPVANSGFSGRSFAAGFIPGLVIGILATAALMFYLMRRKKLVTRNSIFNEKPDRTISDPIYHPQLAARTDFLHKRTASEPAVSATLVSTPPDGFQGYYNPNIKYPAKKTTGSLGSPFDTPTPMPKRQANHPSTPPMRVRGLFSVKSPSLRRKKSQHSLARNASDKRSDISEATIDVRMSDSSRGLGLQASAQGGTLYPPAVSRTKASPGQNSDRGTTYSDVLRAIGVDGAPAKLGSPYRGI